MAFPRDDKTTRGSSPTVAGLVKPFHRRNHERGLILKKLDLDVLGLEHESMGLLFAHRGMGLSLPYQDGIARLHGAFPAVHPDYELPIQDVEDLVPVVLVRLELPFELDYAEEMVFNIKKRGLLEILC